MNTGRTALLSEADDVCLDILCRLPVLRARSSGHDQVGILINHDDEIWKDYQITAWHGGVNDAKHLGWFTAFVKSFDKFEGATLSARIRKYVLWLGFTQQDIDTIRSILLE